MREWLRERERGRGEERDTERQDIYVNDKGKRYGRR